MELTTQLSTEKVLATLFLVLAIHLNCFSQEFSAGINVDSPNPNAVLHLVSPNGNQGLLIPTLTTAQRTAMVLSTAENGLLVYDLSEGFFYYWLAPSWIRLLVSEGQTLSISGTDLTISSGNTVDLSTAEIDPTVPDAIKDGIDWTELTGIPADIADGDDGGGINAVAVDGSTINGDGNGTPLSVGTVPAGQISGLATVATTGNFTDLGAIPAGLADGDDVGLTTVSTADIVDNNVTLAKLEDGAANQVLVTDAGGNPTYIAQTALPGGVASDLVAVVAVVNDTEVDNNITIDGGTVDNTVIGGGTAAAGTFTNLTASGTVNLGANAIQTAEVQDDNITLAKLENGAADQVLVTDAGGNPSYIAQTSLVTGTASDLVAVVAVVNDTEVDDNITIDGGTVDNTVIGGGTAAAGTFTNLTTTGTVNLGTDAIQTAEIQDDNVTLAKLENGAADQVLVTDAGGNPSYIAQTSLVTGTATDLVAVVAVVNDTEVDDNITINAGVIDNTVIGGTTPADGTFSNLNSNGILDVDGITTLNGVVSLGDAPADLINANGTFLGNNALVFAGGTDNAFTTTFNIAEPSAVNTITFPNQTGTVLLSGGVTLQAAYDGGQSITTNASGPFSISGTNDIDLVSNSMMPGAVSLSTNGGSTETIAITNNLGLGTDAIDINALGGGVDIDAQTAVEIDVTNGPISIGGTTSSDFSLAANNAIVETLFISASNTGAGTGDVNITADGNILINPAGTTTINNLTLTSPDISTSIDDINDLELFTLIPTASAVNELSVTNAATGAGPVLSTSGDDPNVDLNLQTKGTGTVNVEQGTVLSFATDGAENVSSDGNDLALNSGGDVLITSTGNTVVSNAIEVPQVQDANNNEVLVFGSIGAAVNEVTISNAVTATAPTISSTGTDVDVDLNINTQGNGNINIDPGAGGVTNIGNLNLVSPDISTSIDDINDLELFTLIPTASAVNELSVTNAATGAGPVLSTSGDDPNVDLNLQTKGTGTVNVEQGTVLSFATDGAENLSSDGNDMTLASGNDITLNPTGNVNITEGRSLSLSADDAEALTSNGTDLDIASGGEIRLSTAGNVRIPQGSTMTFAADNAENLSSDGANFLINSGGDVTITSTGNTVMTNALEVPQIQDVNDNEVLVFGSIGAAVNEVTITNAITATAPTISSTGTDVDVDLNINTQGNGNINIDPGAGGVTNIANLNLVSPDISTSIDDVNGLELFTLFPVASAVNEISISNAITGTGPIISTTGDDPNVDLNIQTQGTGNIIMTATNVGIGVIPTERFQVNENFSQFRFRESGGNASALIGANTTGTAEIVIDASDGDGIGADFGRLTQLDDLTLRLDNVGGNPLVLGTNSVDRIFIDGTGNVGIGNSLPAVSLDINSTNAVQFPVGTTAQRGGDIQGRIRFNTELGPSGSFEGNLDNTAGGWVDLTGVQLPFAGSSGAVGPLFDIQHTVNDIAGRFRNADNTGLPALVVGNDVGGTGQTGGSMAFSALDDSPALRNVARIRADVTDNTAATFSGDLVFVTSGGGILNERMRVNNVGQVGIGTSTPATDIHIFNSIDIGKTLTIDAQGTSPNQLAAIGLNTLGDGANDASQAGTNGWFMTAFGNAFTDGSKQNDLSFAYFSGASENSDILFLDHTGNVGIGVNDPLSPLQIGNDLSLFHFDNGVAPPVQIDGEAIADNLYPSGNDIFYKEDGFASFIFLEEGNISLMSVNSGLQNNSAIGNVFPLLELDSVGNGQISGALEFGDFNGGASPEDGTIRYNGSELQGRQGGTWQNLIGGISLPFSNSGSPASEAANPVFEIENTFQAPAGRFINANNIREPGLVVGNAFGGIGDTGGVLALAAEDDAFDLRNVVLIRSDIIDDAAATITSDLVFETIDGGGIGPVMTLTSSGGLELGPRLNLFDVGGDQVIANNITEDLEYGVDGDASLMILEASGRLNLYSYPFALAGVGFSPAGWDARLAVDGTGVAINGDTPDTNVSLDVRSVNSDDTNPDVLIFDDGNSNIADATVGFRSNNAGLTDFTMGIDASDNSFKIEAGGQLINASDFTIAPTGETSMAISNDGDVLTLNHPGVGFGGNGMTINMNGMDQGGTGLSIIGNDPAENAISTDGNIRIDEANFITTPLVSNDLVTDLTGPPTSRFIVSNDAGGPIINTIGAGFDGQELILLSRNAAFTIEDTGNIVLDMNNTSFNMSFGSTLHLIFMVDTWYEIGRSERP